MYELREDVKKMFKYQHTDIQTPLFVYHTMKLLRLCSLYFFLEEDIASAFGFHVKLEPTLWFRV